MEKAFDPLLTAEGGSVSGGDLSSRLLIQRVASHLDKVERDLLVLETVILSLPEAKNTTARYKLQALDHIIQSISGISSILSEVAVFHSDICDPRIKAIIARHRLKSLECSLLGATAAPFDPSIELF